MHKLLILILASAIVVAANPVAADVAAGNAAYRDGDYAMALREWRAAAESGSDVAQFNVGLLYAQGQGVDVDLAEAAGWYRRAADRNFIRAQYALAELYADGNGVPRDLVQAYAWFKLAGREKYEDARKRRKALAKEMTPKQIALGDLQAREWVRVFEGREVE